MSTAVPGETPDLLTIGELARWADVATSTLRHYEDLGLLEPVDPAADPRLYAPEAVGTVDVILLLREVGFTPREMKELLDARVGSPRSWRQLTERKIAALELQITAAWLARAALEHALGCEHESIVDCPRFRALVADHRAGRVLDDTGVDDPDGPDPPAPSERSEPTEPTGPAGPLL